VVKRCLVGELGIVGIEVGHVLVPGMPSHTPSSTSDE